ncbi:MAG: SUKH-4 family immunity protein [Clostridiaceae bacterium]
MIDVKEITELADKDKIIKYSSDLYSNHNFPEETRKILQVVGVPKYAAPFIDFLEEENGGGKKLSEYYDLNLYEESELIEKEELENIKKYFQEYIVLGNIENDVFVLNEKFRVIRINYETLDEYYINYSLNHFLESLFVYKETIDSVLNRCDKIAFFDDEVTEYDIRLLKNKLLKVDKHAFVDDSFWSSEIERLEENI